MVLDLSVWPPTVVQPSELGEGAAGMAGADRVGRVDDHTPVAETDAVPLGPESARPLVDGHLGGIDGGDRRGR
jgi:hypothetical protein